MAGDRERVDNLHKVAQYLLGLVAGRVAGELPDAAREGQPPESECRPPRMSPNPAWRWLSPEDRSILSVMTDELQAPKAIAYRAGFTRRPDEKPPSEFYVYLKQLARRKILECEEGQYRVNRSPPPPGEEAEDFGGLPGQEPSGPGPDGGRGG